MTSKALFIALAIGVSLGGCGKKGDGSTSSPADSSAHISVAPRGKVREAAENEAEAAAPGSRGKAAASPRVDVPKGALVAGSTPGDRGRDPTLEPAELKVDLGGFTIDRYLYPNDPGKPPMTGVTRAQASEICQQAGGRLCTELEWERACKGPDGTAYATGAAWDPACAKEPATCASGFGVLGMGAALREWTASDVQPIEKSQPKAAVVRGAGPEASGVDHRCARRSAVDATATAADLGFRCCGGPPNAATIPSPQWQQTFRRVDLTTDQAKEMFSSVKQLEMLTGDLAWFKEPDDVSLVQGRSDGGVQNPNVTLTTSPLMWNPVPGEEILVVAGRSGKDAFIVAFYRLPEDRYRIASSFVMKDEKGPVVLGFNGYVRRRLEWATCWDCPGESGYITYRDDNRVVITQK